MKTEEPTKRLQFCRICWEPLGLETSKTDENGWVVHEECFDLQQRNLRVDGR
jgi:hypothetical protein